MNKYLISEGYMSIIFIDDITKEEKEVLAPKYSFNVLADNMETVRSICSLMDTGIENSDFMIFERDEKILGIDKPVYDNYMLN